MAKRKKYGRCAKLRSKAYFLLRSKKGLRGGRPRNRRKGLEGRRFSHLASQFGIGETLSEYLRHGNVKPFGVVNLTVAIFPIVETKYLLIDITRQMKRLNSNVGTMQAALQQRPEVLHAI